MHRLTHTIALIAILIATASTAFAQDGTFLSGPIGTADLERYAQRLNLSQDQRHAIEPAFEMYLNAYRTLRDKEIAVYARGFQMRMMAGMLGDVSQVEDENRMVKSIMAQIAAIDETFFGDIAPQLSESQEPMLDRVRMMRERERYRNHPFVEIARSADLIAIVDGVAMSDADRAAADAILASYEVRLTQHSRRLFESALEAMIDMARLAGPIEFDPNAELDADDEEQAEAIADFFETQQRAHAESLRTRQPLFAEVFDLHLNTYRAIAAAISSEPAHELRRAFYAEEYRHVAGFGNHWERRYETALALEDLTDEQREAIRAQHARFRATQDDALDQAVERVHRYRRDTMDGMIATEEQSAEYDAWLREFRTGQVEEDRRAMGLLQEILGERFAETQPQRRQIDREALARLSQPDAWRVFDSDASSFSRSPGWLVPRSIDRADVEVYARILGLDEEARSILDEHYDAYRERFAELVAPLLEEHSRLDRHAGGHGDDVDETDMEAASESLRNVIRMIETTDISFFDEIGAAFLDDDDDRLELIRLMRRRDLHHPFNTRYETGRRNTSRIDLARVLATMPGHGRTIDWLTLAPDLVTYQQAILPQVIERYRSKVESRDMMRRMMREQYHLHEQDAPMSVRMAHDMRMVRAMDPITKRHEAADHNVATINREHLPRMLDALEPEVAAALEERYTLMAFPNIYSREVPVARLLREAMALPDLTEGQREQLNELATEYHPAYATWIERMLRISRAADEDGPASSDSRAQQRQYALMTRAATERAELQQATVRKLRLILRPEQIDRVRAWPDLDRMYADVIP